MNKLLFAVLMLFSAYICAETAADAMQNKLNALHTMTAQFKQVVKAKKKEVSRSSGTMALERPGRFRWQTKEPMEQLVVADGKKMWVYDTDLEQVTVKKQEKGLGGTAALFLSGYDSNVAKDYNVSQQTKGTSSVFDLKPKSSKANFQRIKLLFTNENLTGLELYDQLGQITYVSLLHIKANPQLDAKLFQFKPPKGVDVVEQ